MAAMIFSQLGCISFAFFSPTGIANRIEENEIVFIWLLFKH